MTKLWFLIKRNVNSITILLLNCLVAVFNPVTTFCIADVMVRDFSRVIEIITIGLIFTAVILNFSSLPKLALLIINSFILAIQIVVIIYIMFHINIRCIGCTYLSAKLGLGVALITIMDRLFEIIHFSIISKDEKLAITSNC
jgi:hypothetical protein